MLSSDGSIYNAANNILARMTMCTKILLKFAISDGQKYWNKNFFQSSEINSANERYNIVERFYETTQLEK